MQSRYQYPISDCDVTDRPRLQAFRDKRSAWVSWINEDEHHAIWRALSDMVWTDVSFRTLANFALTDQSSGLHNYLLTTALLEGHVATQVLAIRRLIDERRDVISLRRILKDVRSNFELFTRQNYVCFDALPYDYESVQHKEMEERVGTGMFWGHTTGPMAHNTARMAHEQFDRLAGVASGDRQRDDALPISIIDRLDAELKASGAAEIAEWSHAYLAHAANPESRKRIADLTVSNDKISQAIKVLARVTEAISAYVLFDTSRSSSLMPVAQFDQFEKLDQPVMRAGAEGAARRYWEDLSSERNSYLDGIELLLKPGTKR